MKNYLLFMAVLLSALNAMAQTPLDSFFQKGAAFTSAEKVSAGQGTYWYASYALLLDNDTMVNGKKYITVRDASRDSMNVTGLIRVDGEKVYYYKTGVINQYGPQSLCITHNFGIPDTTEILLYDFGVQVGDTLSWRQNYVYFTPDSVVVQAIDSVMLQNGQYARRYIFTRDSTGNPHDYWLRGPGSNIGLFGAYEGPGNLHANCYISRYISHSFYGRNCFPLAVKDVPGKNQQALQVYPNPVAGNELRVDLPSPAVLLQVYDITGKVIAAKSDLQKGRQTIVVPDLPGMYMIRVTDERGASQFSRFQKL